MGAFSPMNHDLKTGDTLTVRSAVSNDAAALLTHGRAVVNESEFVLMHPDEFTFTEEQEREWIRQYHDDPGRLLLIAEVSERLVGVLFFECALRRRIAHRGTLHMSVHRDSRGQGIGTALLQSLIAWAEPHPTIETLSLEVFATNATAIGLYRKLGFIEEGRQPRAVKLGDKKYVDRILMYRFVKA